MIITRIELYNLGPYVDSNVFDLNSDSDKNIVLIGGENGAGKTTFFRSIKTCLYGSKAWGFDAPERQYFEAINNLINNRVQYSTEAKAYVEMDLLFNNGKEITTYQVHREWFRKRKRLNEQLLVYRNGALLNESELYDFESYLQALISPDMFNFYFFDGEAIADYFLGNDGGKNFRNAFLKLYGLDTLSIMVSNFVRHSKKSGNDNSAYDTYTSVKNNLLQIEENQKYISQVMGKK